MKKILLVILLASLLLSNVGVVSVSKGKSTILRNGKVIKIKTGIKVEKLDIIKTNKTSIVQIIFKDRTTITVGKNSELSIKDYFFDAKKPSKAKAKFGFARGFFKTVTGKIGKINPDKFKIKVKTSTIGIRGTQFTTSATNNEIKISVSSGEVYYQTQDITTDIKVGEEMTHNIETKKIVVEEKEVVNTQIKKEKKKVIKKTQKKASQKTDSKSEGSTPSQTTTKTTNAPVADVRQENNLLTEVFQEVETTQTVTEEETIEQEPKPEPKEPEPEAEPTEPEPEPEPEPKPEPIEPKPEKPAGGSGGGTSAPENAVDSDSDAPTPDPTPTPEILSEANMLKYIEQAFYIDSVDAETFLEDSKISEGAYQTMSTGSVTAGYTTIVKAKLDAVEMEDGEAKFQVKFGDNTFQGDIKIGDKIGVNFSGEIKNRDLSVTGINNIDTSQMKVSLSPQCSTISGSLYGENAQLLGGIIHFDDVDDGTTSDTHTIQGVFYGGKD